MSRTQLLDAAEDVFSRRGYYDATLKEIAERAEFSVGSIYAFFQSKDDLIAQIFARRGNELLPEVHQASHGAGSPRDRLVQVSDLIIDFFRAHPGFGRLTLRLLNVENPGFGGGPAQEAIEANYTETVALLQAVFVDGQRAGEFHHGDPASFVRMWMSMIHAYHSLDPSVALLPGPDRPEKFSRDDFHAMVERAFSA